MSCPINYNTFVRWDKALDYIPGLSTISNSVDISFKGGILKSDLSPNNSITGKSNTFFPLFIIILSPKKSAVSIIPFKIS